MKTIFHNSKTEEKSRSNCSQLAEMQRISDRMVNCPAFRFQNANSSTSDSSSSRKSECPVLLQQGSSPSRTALCPAATPDEHALKWCRSGNGSASISDPFRTVINS